jgi:hypothetical protein
MPGKIDWSFNVVVAGGPKFSASRSVTVDAYDKVDATIPKKAGGAAGTATVNVQPSGEGKVQILLITSSIYDDKLTYKVDGGSDIKLDEPQLLVGDGIVGLLNKTQKQFVFKNEMDSETDASVQILVGRSAI